jgi:NAD(P)-dependent dehydrogenase (short-subunit alcohol dehydrogenase family)
MELRDRVALVTGGGGAGTGRAVALRLAAEGAAVVVADIDREGGAETVRRVEAVGGRAAFFLADVTSEADMRAAVAFAAETFGALDVLVNSAGAVLRPAFPDPGWGRTLDLCLRGPMLAIEHALPAMLGRGGAIVNIASVAGLGTLSNALIEYAAAKAGLIRLTAVLRPLAAGHGIRVNCVVPDWIATPETSASVAAMEPEERVQAHVPEVLIPPEHIAGAVVRLVRDDAMAGRVLVCWCDGPWALVETGDRGYERAVRVSPGLDSAPSGRPEADR